MPTAFATAKELTPDELAAAPVRYPSPRQWGRDLRLQGAKAAHGADSLGLHTVGDLRALLGMTSSDLGWFADARHLERKVDSESLRHYRYRWSPPR